jgi:hypothetical protein
MKRFVKLVGVAFLVAVVIARWRRMQDTSRQAPSGRREEPISQDPGPASQPVEAEVPGEAGEPESRGQATPAARRTAEELGWISHRWKARAPEDASPSKTYGAPQRNSDVPDQGPWSWKGPRPSLARPGDKFTYVPEEWVA